MNYLEPCMPSHVILGLIQREEFHPCVHLQMYIPQYEQCVQLKYNLNKYGFGKFGLFFQK